MEQRQCDFSPDEGDDRFIEEGHLSDHDGRRLSVLGQFLQHLGAFASHRCRVRLTDGPSWFLRRVLLKGNFRGSRGESKCKSINSSIQRCGKPNRHCAVIWNNKTTVAWKKHSQEMCPKLVEHFCRKRWGGWLGEDTSGQTFLPETSGSFPDKGRKNWPD